MSLGRSRHDSLGPVARVVTFIALVIASSLVAPHLASAQSSNPPPPKRMAAIGDSITQAADACCWYGDHPDNSWSTGGAGWDGISSHFERLRAVSPGLVAYNDAVSGARMSDGPAQAQRAVAQNVHYVTVLLGANDLCTATPETMTDVGTFRSQLAQTLSILDAGLPGRARVFVASIPDVYQLWEVFHEDPAAQFVWDVADICQSLLAPTRTDAQRALVRARNSAFNSILEEECAKFARCRFDDYAVFGFRFGTGHVSKLDYFHPSLSGQAALAQTTWERTWWT
jgi:lysophospholipase L1-like esterase